MVEQVELQGRKRRKYATYRYLPCVGIYLQPVERECPLLRTAGRVLASPAQYRPDPGNQLSRGEGLDHVVGCAQAQAYEPVLLLTPGGQHDQGYPTLGDLRPQQAPVDLQPAQPGQHEVEYDQVRSLALIQLQRLFAVDGRDDRVTVTPQVLTYDLPDVRLVIDHQDLRHRSFHPQSISHNHCAITTKPRIRERPY